MGGARQHTPRALARFVTVRRYDQPARAFGQTQRLHAGGREGGPDRRRAFQKAAAEAQARFDALAHDQRPRPVSERHSAARAGGVSHSKADRAVHDDLCRRAHDLLR